MSPFPGRIHVLAVSLAALVVFGGSLGYHAAQANIRRDGKAQAQLTSLATANRTQARTQPPAVASDKAPERTEPKQSPSLSNGEAFIWPVLAPISSPFGPRDGGFHYGLDLAANAGTSIHAAKSGTVVFAGVLTNSGNTVILKHSDGTRTLYAHCSRLLVHVGQEVHQGDVVGLVGSTGHSTGPHLHFEVYVNDKIQDPLPYLPKR